MAQVSPEAEKLWRLLAHIDSASQEKSIRDLAQERLKVALFQGDVLVRVEAPAADAPKMKWIGTGWVNDVPPAKREDYDTIPKPVTARVEGNFVPPARTLQPEELGGSPQTRVDNVYYEPSPTRPMGHQHEVRSPEAAAAIAQHQQQQRQAAADAARARSPREDEGMASPFSAPPEF